MRFGFGHHGHMHAHRRAHEGGHGRGGRRGRGGRLFDHGDLRLVVLALIDEAPRHGYELIKAIEEGSGGLYAPSPGVVYPTLTMLEELGLIVQQECAGVRKLFAITDAGREDLAREADTVSALFGRMTAAGAERADDSPVFRAMQGLKMALRGRLFRPGVDKETLLQAAAVIDEATARIERL